MNKKIKLLGYISFSFFMWFLFLLGIVKLSQFNYIPWKDHLAKENKVEKTFDYLEVIIKKGNDDKIVCEKSFQDKDLLNKCYWDIFHGLKALENDPVLVMEYMWINPSEWKVTYTEESLNKLNMLYESLLNTK